MLNNKQQKFLAVLKNKYTITILFLLTWLLFFDRYDFVTQYNTVKELKHLEEERQYYLTEIGKKARLASRAMAKASTQQKNTALLQMAMLVRSHASELKVANAKDLAQAAASGNDAAFIDRLTLTDQVIESMAVGLEQIVILQDPIG